MADHWATKRNMTWNEYSQIFHSPGAHKQKLAAAGRAFLKAYAWQNMGDFFADFDQEQKERSLYVDYDFRTHFWFSPVEDLDEMFGPLFKKSGKSQDFKTASERIIDITNREQIASSFSLSPICGAS